MLEQIHQEYDAFYKSFLRQGKFPLRSTKLGFWGASDTGIIIDLFKKIQLDRYPSFIDLGSGDGKVALIASLFTRAKGIEDDRQLFEKGLEVRDKLGLTADFILGNYMKHDLSRYSVVFINPDNRFTDGLDRKLAEELKGILIVYNLVYQPSGLKKGAAYWYDQIPVTLYSK